MEKQGNLAREDREGEGSVRRLPAFAQPMPDISLFSQGFQQGKQQHETIKTMGEKSRGGRCFFVQERRRACLWKNNGP